MESMRRLLPQIKLTLITATLAAAVYPSDIAVAQNRTYMDDFDPEKGVRFEAPEPAGLNHAVSPDGMLRAESKHGELRVVSAKDEEVLHTFATSGGTYSPLFTPDGKNVIAAVSRGNLGFICTVYSWDLETGERTRVGECNGLVLDMSVDSTGKRLAATTWYGKLGSVAMYGEYKKWFGGELVVIDTETPDRSVRIFCELSDVLEFDDERFKGRGTQELQDELNKRLADALYRCLPVRVSLTADGEKVIGMTSTGVVRIFDAQTGEAELLMNSQGRIGSEAFLSLGQQNEPSEDSN